MGAMIYLICMPKAQRLWAYISGKSQVPVLQLFCNTSGKVDSLHTSTSATKRILFICMPEIFDYS